MENKSEIEQVIAVWKEKFSNRSITQEDINWLNGVSPDYRDAILKAIPDSEEVFMDLCIDEDINGSLFFVKDV